MGAVFAAAVFDRLGFKVSPSYETPRSDLIQTIFLENEKNMCLFAQGIQTFSPVDAHVTPIPDDMPGYADKIIMAAGDFVQGSSIELSADGPIRDAMNCLGGETSAGDLAAAVDRMPQQFQNDAYLAAAIRCYLLLR